MKERPILFSAPMVRAILAGTKTQTRRIVKPQQPKPSTMEPYEFELTERDGSITAYTLEQIVTAKCPYGVTGDRLWVRETHAQFAVGNSSGVAPQCVAYRATCDENGCFTYVNDVDSVIMGLQITKWTPAIHMPRWASRITLEVTSVRVERLHAITENDARAEGISFGDVYNGVSVTARAAFYELWTKINGLESWTENPWVWVVEFKRVDAVQLADVQRDELESA